MSADKPMEFPHFQGLTQALNHAADTSPGKAATIMDDRVRSWAQLRERTARLASGLVGLGAGEDVKIAILSLNSDHYTEALYASWWAGSVVVPINTRWSVGEIEYAVRDSDAALILTDTSFLAMGLELQKKVDGLSHLVLIDDVEGAQANHTLEELIETSEPMNDAGRSGDDLAGIYYTGGTTGVSKGVMVPHKAQSHTGLCLAKELNFKTDSIYVHAAPMFHAADSATGGAAAIAGATNIYLPAFSPDALQDCIHEHGVTHSLLVPTMIGMLVASESFDVEKLSSLEFLLYGASPMPMGIMKQALEKLPHVSIAQGYGQTESIPITILPPDYHVLSGPKSNKLTSAGRPAYGCEIQIIDPDTEEIKSTNEVGEIIVKSPNSMSGYWKLEEQTTATIKEGWVHTGDAGYIDSDGFLFIVDRLKDMIVSGGENVYSAEVESAISTHPDVAEVAIIGLPSTQWGETVHAVIVPREGAGIELKDLTEHCQDILAKYKHPKTMELRHEPLPISGAGKVLKRNLRAPSVVDT